MSSVSPADNIWFCKVSQNNITSNIHYILALQTSHIWNARSCLFTSLTYISDIVSASYQTWQGKRNIEPISSKTVLFITLLEVFFLRDGIYLLMLASPFFILGFCVCVITITLLQVWYKSTPDTKVQFACKIMLCLMFYVPTNQMWAI